MNLENREDGAAAEQPSRNGRDEFLPNEKLKELMASTPPWPDAERHDVNIRHVRVFRALLREPNAELKFIGRNWVGTVLPEAREAILQALLQFEIWEDNTEPLSAAEPNINLIDSASDMLTALRDAEWFLAGIAPNECDATPLCRGPHCHEGGCVFDKLQTVRAAIRKATGA